MNKLAILMIFVFSLIGCDENETQLTKEDTVNTITCLTRDGWIDYKTKQNIYSSYGGRNSMWRFTTLDGKTRAFSNCYSFGR